jgi:hypothetical protein
MKGCLPLTATVILITTAQPSLADRIDGDWCSPRGQSISVNGPNVVTPGGQTVVANYDRHHVDFEIPEGEPSSGDRFSADQLNHEEISVSIVPARDARTGKAVIWTLCKPIS